MLARWQAERLPYKFKLSLAFGLTAAGILSGIVP